MHRGWLCGFIFAGVLTTILCSADSLIRGVRIDGQGQLYSAVLERVSSFYIVLDSGWELLGPKVPGQVEFDHVLISPDRRTIGWLVMYPYPRSSPKDYDPGPIAGSLVLYRAEKVLHQFRTEQVFWDWQFGDDGKRVAYSTGPTHGGAAQCVLREVDSGLVIETWAVGGGQQPPQWAEGLRR
jgi:hypothetical protein